MRSLKRGLPEILCLTCLAPIGVMGLSPAPSTAQEYGKRDVPTFYVRAFHGKSGVHPLSYQTASGENKVGQPQPWVLPQGSKVCVEIVNAHPIRYTYAIGQVIDTTTPADEKLPSVAAALAEAFGGSAAKMNQMNLAFVAADPDTKKAVRRGDSSPLGELDWLDTYTTKLSDLAKELKDAQDIAAASDQADDDPGGSANRGITWAQTKLAAMSQDKGHLASAVLDQTLQSWENDAKRDAAAAAQNAKLTGDDLLQWNEMTGTVITALSTLGSAIRSDWQTLDSAYTKAVPSWKDCVTMGQYPIELKLSVKAVQADKHRQIGSDLLHVTVDPYYNWKTVEAAPLGFAIYTPGAEQLTLQNGRVERQDVSLRVRGGAVLVTNVSAFGVYHEQSFGLMLGVGLLDASSTTAGKTDLMVGPIYRHQDLVGIGLGFSLSERDKRREGVLAGQPLPSGIADIAAAVEKRWLPGIVLAISLKGYRF